MDKKRTTLLLLFILLIPVPAVSYCEEKLTVTLFYSSHCKACLTVKQEVLPAMKEKFNDRVEWKELDTFAEENLSLLLEATEKLRGNNAVVPTILVGDTLLQGTSTIEKRLEKSIRAALTRPSSFSDLTGKNLPLVFQRLSVLTPLIGGLIDGVNPCAFAVVVFFISFLTVYGYRRREIVFIGSAYCFAVFTTYLLIGLGIFEALYRLQATYWFIKVFYYAVGGICFLLAGAALYDFVRFKRSGESSGLILQLPSFLKKRINIVIGSSLREKKKRSGLVLIFTSLFIGFMVSLLEAACTGQVYAPVIVFILKNTSLKIKALLYLIIYNIMFVLPLVVVFILSLWGVSSQRLNDFLKRNVGVIKLFMFLLFLAMGVLILWIS